jgi:hypothetical protein
VVILAAGDRVSYSVDFCSGPGGLPCPGGDRDLQGLSFWESRPPRGPSQSAPSPNRRPATVRNEFAPPIRVERTPCIVLILRLAQRQSVEHGLGGLPPNELRHLCRIPRAFHRDLVDVTLNHTPAALSAASTRLLRKGTLRMRTPVAS